MAKADIVNLMYSKDKSPLEFQFEQITAPPLLSFVTMEDISQLYKIATSLKFSGKIKKKYEMIDSVLTPRGFVKFHCGTNRIIYRHLENTSIIIKVALDRVGLGDNPAEYKNQFELKPFVCKVFEVDPTGVIGLFERVLPITSREEFITIAEDYFTLLTEKILGEYIMEDIGTEYFMNVGIRNGFGIVILDFPYLYKLDGNKLVCTNTIPDTAISCNGLIDYDEGFNNLICTRCGKLYLATELKDDSATIKIEKEGIDMNMKVVIRRGNDIVRESENSTDTIVRDTFTTDSNISSDESKMVPVIRRYPRNNNRGRRRDNRKYNRKDNNQASDVDITRHQIESNVKIKRSVNEDNVNVYEKKEEDKVNKSSNTKERPSVSKKVKLRDSDTNSLEVPIKDLGIDLYEKLGMENPNKEKEESLDTVEDINDENDSSKLLEDNINRNDDLLDNYGLKEEDFEEPEDDIEEKYSHLSKEYNDNEQYEKIQPKNPKELY